MKKKTVIATVGAMLVSILVSCNPKLQNSTKSSEATGPEKIVFNAFELKEDSEPSNNPRYTVWIRTEDVNVPYYIFVNLDKNRNIYSYYGLDWRGSPFKLRSFTLISDGPRGISLAPDYGTTINKLTLYVDKFCVPGKGEIVVQMESFPLTVEALQNVIDSEPLDFAWSRVSYPGHEGGGRVISSSD